MGNTRKRKNPDGAGHEANHKFKSESKGSTAVPAIGIDLGTTYSCVAVIRRGQVEVIKDPLYNEPTVPSHVHFPREGNPLVGRAAKDMVHKDEEPKVFDAKRLIGRKFSDKEVQEDMKLWPFTVVRGKDDTPLIQLRDEAVRPEVISAHILSHLKRTAETRLNLRGQIKNAVITVPAYFNDAQRQATKDAGEIAGLNILRIINEPTAAAMAYDLDSDDKGERNVLIFDLGGGTFDISVLKIKKGDIRVMAVGGDTHLGGEDFDNELVSFCLRKFQEKHNVHLLRDVGREERNLILHRIREQCEQMKRVLSQGTTVTVKVYKINATHDLQVEISRKAFEELCSLRFEKCIKEVRKTLVEAGLDKSEVDEVVLAGGSARIPKVQKMLSTLFGGKELKFTQSVDEVVACGAARLASLLNNVAGAADDAFKISDVIPKSLGVEAEIHGVKDQMSIIIPKNTKIPCAITMDYHTVYDNQTAIQFPVYEGEDPVAANNRLLGEFTLKRFPARPAREESADVTMEFDLNGILTVTAVGVNVRIKGGIKIDSHTGSMEQTEKEKLKASFAKREKALGSYLSKMDTEDDDDNESDNDF